MEHGFSEISDDGYEGACDLRDAHRATAPKKVAKKVSKKAVTKRQRAMKLKTEIEDEWEVFF